MLLVWVYAGVVRTLCANHSQDGCQREVYAQHPDHSVYPPETIRAVAEQENETDLCVPVVGGVPVPLAQ